MSEFVMPPYPWQRPTWRSLQARRRAGQFPHALALHGVSGLGKRKFADALAHSVLCRNSDADGNPCGMCGDCRLLASGTHPDVMRVERLEDKKEIVVDQIRELRDIMTLRSHRSGFKIVIIDPADVMNVNAANALLKTLEEPSGDSLLMLVTTRLSALPPTVRSRCQQLKFVAPPRAEAMAWLQSRTSGGDNAAALLDLASGAPLRALRLAEEGALANVAGVLGELESIATGKANPIAVAERWVKSDIPATLSWISRLVADLVRLKFDAPPSLINNVSRSSVLIDLARQIDAQRLLELHDRVREVQRDAHTQLNPQMLLEGMLLFWNDRFTTMTKPTPRARS